MCVCAGRGFGPGISNRDRGSGRPGRIPDFPGSKGWIGEVGADNGKTNIVLVIRVVADAWVIMGNS